MNFDESIEQSKLIQVDKNGKPDDNSFIEPFNSKQIISNAGWSKMKDGILEMKKDQLHNINRQLKLQEPTDNYMTKLDLIDDHPELFDDRKEKLKITPLEIE